MGFFTSTELAKSAPVGCAGCGLFRTCHSPRMGVTGYGRRGIFVLAEAPGAEEDAQGVQLVGKAGQTLRGALRRLGVDLDEDCWKLNAVNCRPPENRTPTPKEIEACRPTVLRAIQERQPALVLALGQSALTSLYGHRFRSGDDEDSGVSIAKTRGLVWPDRELGCWVSSTYHPSYINRMDFDPVVKVVWLQDLEKPLRKVEENPPLPPDPLPYAKPLTDRGEIAAFLERIIQRRPFIAFDYETSGLKPYAKGHRAYSVGIAVSRTTSRAFVIPYDDPEIRGRWWAILKTPEIHKTAHNVQFEAVWSRASFGVWPEGWMGDTRLVTHLEDCRRGVSGLKWQGFVRYGVIGYEDACGRFLRPSSADSAQYGENAHNRVDKALVLDLLKYNAVDALLTRWIWEDSRGL